MSIGRVHSLDSFGTVDGPGIRFVVFMQGCQMRCLYCHNRDTWDLRKGGELMNHEDLLQRILKVKHFLSGGVTVTGGEPLLQAEFVADLFEALQKHGIHTCLDTNGFIKHITPDVERLLAHTNLVMLDIKHPEESMHQQLTHATSLHTRNFAAYLKKIQQPTWIRYVVVEGFTVDPIYADMLGELVSNMGCVEKVELLPYHSLGIHKWDAFFDTYQLANVHPPSREQLDAIKERLAAHGVASGYSA